jgi:hypothetical protein
MLAVPSGRRSAKGFVAEGEGFGLKADEARLRQQPSAHALASASRGVAAVDH